MEERPGTIDEQLRKEMNALEARKDLIKSALDASPHKIAMISFNKDGVNSTTVVWQDDKGNIFFAENVKAPIQWGAAPEGTLKTVAEAQTVKAYPLDFSLKHGAAASAKAELFMAELKKNIMAAESTETAAQRAFEKVDPNLGVTPRDITNAVMKMGLGSLISGHDTDLPQAPPGGGVKADGYRFPGWKTEVSANIRDQYEKWVKNFPEAADYLKKELLGELGKKINFKLEDIVKSDIIVTKSSILDTLNDILEKLEAKHEEAYLALAKIIVTYVTGEELRFGNSLTLKGVIIPGILASIWPGVLDAARENSALGLQSDRDEIEADSAATAAAIATALAPIAENTAIANAAASEHAETTPGDQSDYSVALTDAAKSELGTLRHEAGSDAQLAAPFITAHEDSFPFSMFSQQGTQPQESATVNEDLHSENVLIATDTESPSTDDSASPAALTDSDGGSHSEQTTTASDNESATPKEGLTDGEGPSNSIQVAFETETGDASKDADSHSEQPGIILGEDILAPAKAAMETAKAFMEPANPQEGANLTAHDQPVPHGEATMSAIFGQQDSFPSSMFANVGTPTQVPNQALTAEQLPAQAPAVESPHPAAPETESLGNAVPSVTPVVHHDELAP
jgi:hypothetical protein